MFCYSSENGCTTSIFTIKSLKTTEQRELIIWKDNAISYQMYFLQKKSLGLDKKYHEFVC